MQAITQSGAPTAAPDAIPLPMFRRVGSNSSSTESADPVPKKPSASIPPTVQSVTKLELEAVGAGDKVVIKTMNSTYNFEMKDHFNGRVIPSKSSARSGDVVLMGGLNADVTEHTPNRVYVGGRLAYQFPDEESCILTSAIESIFLVQARRD